MTENGLNLQTISSKRTDNQSDYVLLLRLMTNKKEEALPPHFLKFLLASRTSGTFGFAQAQEANPPAKPNEPLFSQRHDNKSYFATMYYENINE